MEAYREYNQQIIALDNQVSKQKAEEIRKYAERLIIRKRIPLGPFRSMFYQKEMERISKRLQKNAKNGKNLSI